MGQEEEFAELEYYQNQFHAFAILTKRVINKNIYILYHIKR